MKTQKPLFQRINETSGTNTAPFAEGPNVFNAEDYAKAIGIAICTARLRIRKMVDKGEIRRVRTRKNGSIVPAFEYLGD